MVMLQERPRWVLEIGVCLLIDFLWTWNDDGLTASDGDGDGLRCLYRV